MVVQYTVKLGKLWNCSYYSMILLISLYGNPTWPRHVELIALVPLGVVVCTSETGALLLSPPSRLHIGPAELLGWCASFHMAPPQQKR